VPKECCGSSGNTWWARSEGKDIDSVVVPRK
jgi:hypothetical protein